MIYLMQAGENICLSNVPGDHPDWESNHIILMDEHFRGRPGTYQGLRNIVTNILRAADVPFVEE